MDSQSPIIFNGDSPLHVAVRQGQIEDVRKILIHQQVDVNILNSKHETPLHLACSKRDSPIVQLLVAFGADPFIKDSNNENTYHRSGFDVRQLIDKLLFSHGLRLWIDGPVQVDKESPLHTAVRVGGVADIQRIIEEEIVDINDTNANLETPLHLACALGHKHIVHILMSHGANMYKRDIFNNAPIHRAVSQGHVDTVDYLRTDYACNPKMKGYQGRTLLHFACGIGNVKLVTTLIKKYGISPMATDAVNQTPLHIAASYGQEEVVHLLITNYDLTSTIDCRSNGKLSPLHLACYCGHESVVKILVLEHKADLNARDESGSTPFQKVAMGGSSVLLQLVTTYFDLNPLSATDDCGNTALHVTCWYGHEDVSRLLITKYNCPANIENKIKETPLHKACSIGHNSIVRMLVSEFKADVTQRDHNNNTSVSKAAEGGHVETVKALITELGCSPNVTGYDGRSLLHEACWSGSIKLTEMLIIDFSLDVLSVDDSGNAPLHLASLGGHEELARLLITKYNCPVNNMNKEYLTPLHKACSFGHLSVVKMLISEFNADKYARNNQSSTPLGVAVLAGHVSIVQVLINEFDCSPQVKGFKGGSLLHYAGEKGHTKLAMILITDFKLDPLSVDNDGNTPLHLACLSGHEELARLLITKYNCPVDIVNKKYLTPLHKACSFGHLSVVKMLISEFNADKYARNNESSTPLGVAVLAGHVSIVQVLVNEFDCSPQVKGIRGRSLLHYACATGHTKLAMVLITDFKLDPLSVDDDGNTPLHMACLCGQEEMARLLITKYNCPIDVKNENKQTSLHMACFCGHLDVSKVLISECILKGNKRFYNALDKDNNTPLNYSIKRGDAKAVHILSTEYGLKPHVRGIESKPLLHQLAAGGITTMLKELISKFNHDPACSDEDGNTILHIAAQHGQFEIAEFLIINHSNQYPIDQRNSQGQTALHCACIGGHTRVAKFLVANKADITIRDEDGDTPFKKAFLTGHELTLFKLFDSNLRRIDDKLLRQVCSRGSVDLIDVLLSDFHLDPSAIRGHKQVLELLIKKYKCPIDSRNANGQTPLHLLCSQSPTENGRALIRMCVSEFKADVTIKDNNDDQPIHAAVQAGYSSKMVLDHGVSPNSRGFKKRSLLHFALAKGHTSTAKTLIEDFHLSLHCVDEDGNTPLHISSLFGQPESLRCLLYEYHAPVYVRNKAGKIALDFAMEDSTKKVIREYVKSEHNRIQYEYEELRAKSKQKYSGKQIITRVSVLGNPGSGKSTLVESLKRKGIFSSLFTVTEADVPLHTAGIIPSVHQSKEAGRLLYYDFAGDKEYYSSHAAILEIISDLTVGNNVYFIVADLRKDNVIIHNEIGYWLSFVAYHGKASDNQCRLKIVVILSHSDHLSSTDCISKIKNVRQYLHAHKNQYDEIFNIIEVVSSNCCSPRSTRSIESIFQQISKDTPPCSISYEASMLHGILENDFNHVVACKFQGLLSHVKDANICLPTIADLLFPIVKELHDIGLLTMIGRSGDSPEDYLLLLNLSSLTHEVHQNLFSKSAMMMFSSSIGPQYANMGILPESYLARLLPDHISKECLVQLQYCQEFTCADVGLDSSGVSNSASEKNLLYFPALCKLDSEQSNWPTDPLLNFSIGWYAKCTGKFDYFPPRFLHVLLLRLAFTFALPIANCHITEFNEISAHNRRCTMWKNGIRWLMEEGVECIFETVNDNKGIIVITKSEEGSKEWANVLSKIVNKTLQAKAEFCSTISLYHFLLKSDNTSSFMNEDKLFEIAEIESVIKEGNKEVTSVSGRTFLDSSHLDIFRKYTFWGM